jgi:hypothetical protein
LACLLNPFDGPVFLSARQFSNDEGWAKFSRLLIGLGKAKENYLAFRDHVNDSLRSSREYEEISLSMPRIADDNEKSVQSLSSDLLLIY